MSGLSTAAALGLAPSTNVMTLPMRKALGFVHASALLMQRPVKVTSLRGHWRCRAFPDELIADQTVQALLERGWIEITTYASQGFERHCATVTDAGHDAYRAAGGRHVGLVPAPLSAELLIAKFDDALATIAGDMASLAAAAKTMIGRIEADRSDIAAALAEGERITARIAELTRLQSRIAKLRDEERAKVAGARP